MRMCSLLSVLEFGEAEAYAEVIKLDTIFSAKIVKISLRLL